MAIALDRYRWHKCTPSAPAAVSRLLSWRYGFRRESSSIVIFFLGRAETSWDGFQFGLKTRRRFFCAQFLRGRRCGSESRAAGGWFWCWCEGYVALADPPGIRARCATALRGGTGNREQRDRRGGTGGEGETVNNQNVNNQKAAENGGRWTRRGRFAFGSGCATRRVKGRGGPSRCPAYRHSRCATSRRYLAAARSG